MAFVQSIERKQKLAVATPATRYTFFLEFSIGVLRLLRLDRSGEYCDRHGFSFKFFQAKKN